MVKTQETATISGDKTKLCIHMWMEVHYGGPNIPGHFFAIRVYVISPLYQF